MDALSGIKRIQKELNLSTNEFAKKVGIPRSTLTSMYSKDSQPSEQTINRICDALGITPLQLIFDIYCTADLNEEQTGMLKAFMKNSPERRKACRTLMDSK